MNWWKWLLSLVALLVTATITTLYALLYLSLPAYEGEHSSDIANAARLERDELGYLSIHAANRNDAAFALGFSHAQDRFFQMDLLRRSAAGELSALFGERAVSVDKALRQHRFRQRAQSALAQLTATENQLLSDYSRGVNHGLAALKVRPFEYLLLRQHPERWQNADSILVIYTMYLDLQGKLGSDDYAMTVLKQSIPTDWYRFLQQESDIWHAALDHSKTDGITLPDSPYPQALRHQLSSCTQCQVKDATDIGSNNFAVAGSLTAHGSAILADDMHLTARVPGIWYKAQLNWRDGDKIRTVTGLTLPGAPAVVVGSNGKLAWGFTNSTADWHDLVALQLSDDGKRYLTADGWQNLQYYYETIKVAGGADQTVELAETYWGPVVRFGDSPAYALRWVGYDSQAVNLNLLALEHATTAEQALALAPSFGIPSQNLLAADSTGGIGWRLTNRIPKRQLDDFDTAQDWSDGRQGWFGVIDEAQHLSISEAERLWTANARMIGGEFYRLIGNGGYDLGARGWQIQQSLNTLKQADEQALHAIQLDNRALMLERWRELLLTVLTNDVVSAHQLQAYRQYIITSSQRAAADDVGYSLVRAFRLKLLELQFAPLSAYLEQHGAQSQDLKYSLETPLWALLQQRRADTLPEAYASWDALLLETVLQSKTQLEQQFGSLHEANWGNINTARISHPLASAVPLLGDWLNMPATPLNGDSHMPRVQRPGFGQSQRMVVAPGQEQLGILTIPAGQSGHPLSPFYRGDHHYWLNEVALPFLPGEKKYQLLLTPQG
ncbi:penicillin acylase family protein [Rheinheimera fenheensis]|uniref:penicillin acylase family protein n=1 Tax=Rheinheimera fenheensis TaxID=3152295 RepID=UPI00325E31AD